MLNPESIRKDFPIFAQYEQQTGERLVYLDSAASSQTPRQVVEAMDDYYFSYRGNVHRSAHMLSLKATHAYEQSRSSVAAFIGAEPWEIIFTAGATIGINMLVLMLEQKLQLGSGDEIVVTISDHHSNFIPFQELAKRTKAKLRILPMHGTDLDYAKAAEYIGPNTKLVALPLASNVLGTVFDVAQIARLAHAHGAYTIVDATTAVGHRPISVSELEADFLFFSGHKMLGPTGIGVLFGRAELLEKLQPSFFGGGVIDSVTETDTVYRDIPARFEPGTPNIAGAIGLFAAVQHLSSLEVVAIKEHTETLVRSLSQKLARLPGVQVVSELNPAKNVGIVSFVLSGMDSHAVAEVLSREHISCRGGFHCAMPLMTILGAKGVVRASMYIYNDTDDLDALIAGIQKAQKSR